MELYTDGIGLHRLVDTMEGPLVDDKYRALQEGICDLVEEFGQRSWWIIYQGDVRMRSEEFEMLRRTEESELAKYKAISPDLAKLSDFDPKRPWNSVLLAAYSKKSKDFWDREVRFKALRFLGGQSQAAEVLDDGTAQPELMPSAGAASAPHQGGGKRARPEPAAPSYSGQVQSIFAPPAKKARHAQGHPMQDGDNLFITNGRGAELCRAHDAGSCQFGTSCSRAHQCRKCLSPKCTSGACLTTAPTKSMMGMREGPHKGKGKGKGGKAKGKQF